MVDKSRLTAQDFPEPVAPSTAKCLRNNSLTKTNAGWRASWCNVPIRTLEHERGAKIVVRSVSVAATTDAPEAGCRVTPLLKRGEPSGGETISPMRSATKTRFKGGLLSHWTALIAARTSRSALSTLTIAPTRNVSGSGSALGFMVICEPATAITRPSILSLFDLFDTARFLATCPAPETLTALNWISGLFLLGAPRA